MALGPNMATLKATPVRWPPGLLGTGQTNAANPCGTPVVWQCGRVGKVQARYGSTSALLTNTRSIWYNIIGKLHTPPRTIRLTSLYSIYRDIGGRAFGISALIRYRREREAGVPAHTVNTLSRGSALRGCDEASRCAVKCAEQTDYRAYRGRGHAGCVYRARGLREAGQGGQEANGRGWP